MAHIGAIGDVFSVRLRTAAGGINPQSPLDFVDVTGAVSGLTYSTVRPGGYEACTITFDSPTGLLRDDRRVPTAQRRTVADGFVDVQILAQSALVWEGRAPQTVERMGEVRQIVAQGYGLSGLTDGVLAATGSTAVTPLALLTLITQQLPLFAQSAVDGPAEPTALLPTNINNQTPAQALDALTKSGMDNLPALLDWWCWARRRLLITVRTPPQQPDYRVPWDETTEVHRDWSAACSTVVVGYQNNASSPAVAATVTQTNRDFLADWGILRTQLVNIGTCSTAYATNYAQVYLAVNAGPTYQTTLTRSDGQGLETVPGGEKPAYLVTADGWIQLGTLTPYLPIMRAEYVAESDTLTVEIGDYAHNYETLIGRLRNASQYQAARLSPSSGMPL